MAVYAANNILRGVEQFDGEGHRPIAITLSVVITAVVLEKTGALNRMSEKRTHRIEGISGMLSGLGIAGFGTLFPMANLNAAGWG